MPVPGCGWYPKNPETGSPGPMEPVADGSGPPCAARDGYIPIWSTNDDNWTIDNIGLCQTCLQHPADLLHDLSKMAGGAL